MLEKGICSFRMVVFYFRFICVKFYPLIVFTGLVVAVKDHEHFRLKMLFTQKKKTEHENKQIRGERDSYKVSYYMFLELESMFI